MLSPGVRQILQTIVNEMGGCKDGKCDDHAVRFGHDALVAAKAALAICPGCDAGYALCADHSAAGTRYYHFAPNGAAVPHIGPEPKMFAGLPERLHLATIS